MSINKVAAALDQPHHLPLALHTVGLLHLLGAIHFRPAWATIRTTIIIIWALEAFFLVVSIHWLLPPPLILPVPCSAGIHYHVLPPGPHLLLTIPHQYPAEGRNNNSSSSSSLSPSLRLGAAVPGASEGALLLPRRLMQRQLPPPHPLLPVHREVLSTTMFRGWPPHLLFPEVILAAVSMIDIEYRHPPKVQLHHLLLTKELPPIINTHRLPEAIIHSVQQLPD